MFVYIDMRRNEHIRIRVSGIIQVRHEVTQEHGSFSLCVLRSTLALGLSAHQRNQSNAQTELKD
jgi:hypothetical protein